MKKSYKTLYFEVVLFPEDAVRCSNTFEKGDDIKEDIY